MGLDVIVTDHHSLPAIQPPSIANCNPKTLPENHPLHHLPGVGVAYKLAELILERYSKDHSALSRSLLDLVALGMIADMAALRAENRLLTKRGLELLARTSKPGLRELLKLSGALRETNAEHIGFGMAPRINAAGRLADAFRAVELMITEDQTRAEELAKELDAENIERQVLCEQHFEEALNLIALERTDDDACIVLAQEGWHHGVIGIVASRIVDRFHLPVFIVAIERNAVVGNSATSLIEGSLAKGSVRSIDVDNLDIFKEMQEIQAKHQIFTKFGGHRAAAGFSIDTSKVDELKTILKAHFKQRLGGHNLAKTIRVDSALMLSELDFDFLARIESLAPYGIGNPSPLFIAGPLKIRSWRRLGKDAKHIKLALSQNSCIGRERIPVNNKTYEALIWQRAEEFLKYIAAGHDELVAVFTIKSSEYMGEKSLQMEIRDWKMVQDIDSSLFARFQRQVLSGSTL